MCLQGFLFTYGALAIISFYRTTSQNSRKLFNILQKCMLVSVLYLAKESQMIMQTASTDPLRGNDQNLWCKNDITFVTVQKTAFGARANVFG